MNIKLTNFFTIIAIALFSIMLAIIYQTYQLYKATNELALIEHQRYQMTLKADELRQSSDDLTRMARTYVITKDQQFKDNYYKILDIRNGKAPRPKDYEGIYWDLSKEVREKKHPDEKAISLEQEMHALPYSANELQQLHKSKDESDKLVKLEIKAFKHVKDLTIENNQSVQLLYSQKYHNAKEKILLPIDEFLSSIKERTQEEINTAHKKIEHIFQYLFFFFILGSIILLSTILVVMRKVLNPIKYLHKTILAFQSNKNNIEQQKFYKDEIGQVIEQFFRMKEEIEKDRKKLYTLATTDPLTHILNRRAFFEVANSFFTLAKRESKDLSVILIDIDFFKKVNDTYGHLTGDHILKHLVQCVQKSIRQSDLFARYGGEEFIVLLPDTDYISTQKVAQKIRLTIQETPLKTDSQNISITISAGFSTIHENDNSLTDIIARADKALYQAKENGRNRVEGLL